MKVIELHKSVTDSNDRDAQKRLVLIDHPVKAQADAADVLLPLLTEEEADIYKRGRNAKSATKAKNAKIENAGARSIQVHTDGMCHMDAGMTRTGLEEMGLEDVDLAFLENIGNLICPAEYDTGAIRNVMILSIPEGDDKPLKYPLMFQSSDVLLITKIDSLPYFNFDMDKCIERVRFLNPNIRIIPVSAKSGKGMKEWEDWLKEEIAVLKQDHA